MKIELEISILGQTFYRYQLGIFDMCEILHMSTTGAAEPSPVTMHVAHQYLLWRLENWTLPYTSPATYDHTVAALIRTTLIEYEAWSARPTEEEALSWIEAYGGGNAFAHINQHKRFDELK